MRTYKSKSESRNAISILQQTPVSSLCLPNCQVTTSVHIHGAPQEPSSVSTYCLSRSIQLHPSLPTRLTLHQYQQFKSNQFEFDQLTHHSSSDPHPLSQIDIFQTLIEEERDLCVLAVGGPTSALKKICQGQRGGQGEFYCMIAQLWDKLSAASEAQSQESIGLSSATLHLHFLTVANDKLHDLLEVKGEPRLQQGTERVSVRGCRRYNVQSIHQLCLLVEQVLQQRRLVYPESILIIGGQLTYSLKIDPSSQMTRYFDLFEWQKSLNYKQHSKTPAHNNQSLLHLNICLHQLYKLQCHHPSKITQSQCNQLWAKFRNTPICKLLKNYLVKGHLLFVLGCITLAEQDQKQNYQTLMLCKNIGKVRRKEIAERKQRVPKVSTTRRRQDIIERVRSRNSEGEMSRVKEQLTRILQERQEYEQRHKQQEVMTLLREERQHRQKVDMLRYQKEQMQIKEDFSRITKVLHPQRRNNTQPMESISILLPTIHQSPPIIPTTHGNPTSHMSQQWDTLQSNSAAKATHVHEEVISSIQRQNDLGLSRKVLSHKIKEQEEEIQNYLKHKRNIVGMLKRELNTLKQTSPSPPIIKSKAQIVNVKNNKKIKEQKAVNSTTELHYAENQGSPPLPSEFKEPIQSAEKELVRKGRLNKANYRFEQRRQRLKSKLAKGREDLSAFYDEATRNYQNYHRKSQ